MSKAIPYIWCLLGSIACCGFLLLALWESAKPHEVPVYAVPGSGLATLACTILAVRSLRKRVGNAAFALAPICIFLGSIPVWLILEVTVI